MSSTNKRKGTQWENLIEEHFNSSGLQARRLPRAGTKDIGDVAVELSKSVLVIEAKNVKDAAGKMAQFLREAQVEAGHYEERYDRPAVPCVITKTRGKGPHESRVTMTLEDFLCLLRWNGAA